MTMMVTAAAHASVIVNFDDLVGSSSLPVGYAGLNWDSQWVYYDGAQDPYNPSSFIYTNLYSQLRRIH
jgi:hypothetical protein